MQQSEDLSRIGRREFSRRIAAGAGLVSGIVTGSAVSATACASEDTAAPKKAEDPKPDVPEAPVLPPEVLLLTYLIRQYPNEHFDEPTIQGVFRDIRGDVVRGKALASFPLKNSEEPVIAFRAYRTADGTPADM